MGVKRRSFLSLSAALLMVPALSFGELLDEAPAEVSAPLMRDSVEALFDRVAHRQAEGDLPAMLQEIYRYVRRMRPATQIGAGYWQQGGIMFQNLVALYNSYSPEPLYFFTNEATPGVVSAWRETIALHASAVGSPPVLNTYPFHHRKNQEPRQSPSRVPERIPVSLLCASCTDCDYQQMANYVQVHMAEGELLHPYYRDMELDWLTPDGGVIFDVVASLASNVARQVHEVQIIPHYGAAITVINPLMGDRRLLSRIHSYSISIEDPNGTEHVFEFAINEALNAWHPPRYQYDRCHPLYSLASPCVGCDTDPCGPFPPVVWP